MKTFLKRLEKWLDFDLRYVVKNGLWLGLDDLTSILASVLLTVVFANSISKETYGSYRYILSVFGILSITTLPNMNIAVSGAVARGSTGILKKAFKTRIRWGFFGSIASLIFGIYYFTQNNSLMSSAFALVALFLPFMDSLNLYEGFLRGKKLFNLQSQYAIVTRLISTIVLIGTIFLTKNLIIILIAFFLPYVITRLYFYLYTSRNLKTDETITDQKTITYGKHLSVIQLLGVLVNYLDNVLIFSYLGPISLAVYSIALAPIKKVQQAFSIIPDLALPKFSERSIEVIKKKLPRQIIRGIILVVISILLYMVFVEPLFKIFFPRYLDSVPYSQTLAIILIGLPFSLIYTLLQSHARTKEIYIYNVSIRIAQLIAILVLVSLYGIWGAVWARIALQIVSIPILITMLVKIKDKNIEKPPS